MQRTQEYLANLLLRLIEYDDETEWIEFKENKKDPEMIGEDISALSNSAALKQRKTAYLIWGINDSTHEIEGTSLKYRRLKKGNEEIEPWLMRLLSPRINFHFYEFSIEEKNIVLLEIPCAANQPVAFSGTEFIRIGTSTKKLKAYPEKEKELWRIFDTTPFESRIAIPDLSTDEVLQTLDYPGYYDISDRPIPLDIQNVLKDFSDERFILKNDSNSWDITNLGALLFAKDLDKINHLRKKCIRVIKYKNNSKLDTIQERSFNNGYALSYESIIDYIMAIIPQEEVIQGFARLKKLSFPEIAIRELMANMIIHQDFEITGTSPMIEIFANRIVFSNAGKPMVEIDRIINTVPRSRNELLAGFMHKCRICEERGSGYDKIVDATCIEHLIAPRIENQSDLFTKVTLFSKVPFELISTEDRIRTCYMKTCLCYENGSFISNAIIRGIFGLEEKDSPKASRIIKNTVKAGLIKPVDPDTAPKHMRYVPYWT